MAGIPLEPFPRQTLVANVGAGGVGSGGATDDGGDASTGGFVEAGGDADATDDASGGGFSARPSFVS